MRSASRKRRRALALAMGVLTAFVALDAAAFCRSTTCRSTNDQPCTTDDDGCPSTGAKLFWPTSCVGFSLQKNGTQDLDLEDTRVALKKAFFAWSDVDCGGKKSATMTFSELQDVSCNKSQYNPKGANVNVVLFKDDDWTYHGIDGTLAKTSVTYNNDTGEIYDADIEVNTANNTVTLTDPPQKVEYDLQAIMTHEVGHFIGIAHAPDPNAVMYASYEPGSTSQRVLTADDVAALCAIYPPERVARCDLAPRGGFGPTCDNPPKSGCGASPQEPGLGSAGLVPAALAGLVLAVLRRRIRGVKAPR